MLANTPLGRLGDRRRTSRARYASSPPTRPRSSRARCCSSTADWGCSEQQRNGRKRVVITGLGAVTPLGNDVETTWDNLLAGESGAAEIDAVRRQRVPGALRLRAEGLRPDRVDRPQDGAAHGPLRPDGHRGCAPGRGGRWARDRATSPTASAPRSRPASAASKCVPGLLRHADRDAAPTASTRSRSRRSSRTWAPAGSRWSSARAGRCRRSARPAPRRTWPSARAPTRSGSAAPT